MQLQSNIKEVLDMDTIMPFVWAFLIGGAICVFGQLMLDIGKLTPAHTMSSLVVMGAIVDGLGWYDPFIRFAGAGATVPITSFGNALVHGAVAEIERDGWIGVITGIFEVTSAGISSAIIFSFLAALLFKPKG
jgi:stage V sporulation protein AE